MKRRRRAYHLSTSPCHFFVECARLITACRPSFVVNHRRDARSGFCYSNTHRFATFRTGRLQRRMRSLTMLIFVHLSSPVVGQKKQVALNRGYRMGHFLASKADITSYLAKSVHNERYLHFCVDIQVLEVREGGKKSLRLPPS